MQPDDEKTSNEKTSAPEQSAPPPKRGVWARLVNKDTRFGRFNRALLRWLAIVLSLFLLGLLAAYFALVRPLQLQNEQYRASLAAADETTQRLEQINVDKGDLEKQLADLQAAAAVDADHILLLRATGKLQDARIAYLLDDRARTRELLLETRTLLVKLTDALNKNQPGRSAQLQARLDLALSELDKDAKLANADMTVLYDSLVETEAKLFPARP